MARFIELHNDGRAALINLDSVQIINHFEDGTAKIFFIDDEYDSWLKVDESYSSVKEIVMGKCNEQNKIKDSLRAEMDKP